MSEILAPTELTAQLPPPQQQGEETLSPEAQLKIRYNTFEEARQAPKKFSDEFIDGCLNDSLQVGENKVGTKGYLDKVESTPTDKAIINNPESIAGSYLATTDMLARNIKFLTVPGMTDERKNQLIKTKSSFLDQLKGETQETADQIVDWCDGKSNSFPVAATEYRGMDVDGHDPLNSMDAKAEDFRSNLTVQRQIGGTFIMGYSDTRVAEKLHKQDRVLTQRIYLNPDIMAAPEVFEKVLQAANESGISLQLKMLQRASELATAHKGGDALRGDGIVIYAHEASANDVLALALAVAKDHPEAFTGRKTSRIPQKVAEGIAIGDEPVQAAGKSLTSHREEIIDYVAQKVRESGKTGQGARDSFRRGMIAVSRANGVDPNNISFNLPAAA